MKYIQNAKAVTSSYSCLKHKSKGGVLYGKSNLIWKSRSQKTTDKQCKLRMLGSTEKLSDGSFPPACLLRPAQDFFLAHAQATRWQLLPTRWQWVCPYQKALACFTRNEWCMWPLKPQICLHPGCYQFGEPPQSCAWHTLYSQQSLHHFKFKKYQQ